MVRRRELRPPVVQKIEVPETGVPAEEIFGEIVQNGENRVIGWTFVYE